MKRIITSIAGVAFALLLAAQGFAIPQPLIGEAVAKQLPDTHSENLRALMVSPRSDASDRTFDSQAWLDRAQMDTNAHIRDLQKILVYSDDASIRKELDQYTQVQKDLNTLSDTVAVLQKNIHQSIGVWKNAENLAAKGQTVNAKSLDPLESLTHGSLAALTSYNQATERLTAEAKALNNPRLQNLAEFLTSEGKALTKVVDLSKETKASRATAAKEASPSAPAIKTSEETVAVPGTGK